MIFRICDKYQTVSIVCSCCEKCRLGNTEPKFQDFKPKVLFVNLNNEMTSCHVENFDWPTLNFSFSLAVIVLCLFLAVPWAGLWFVIVTFPGRTHLLFYSELLEDHVVQGSLF